MSSMYNRSVMAVAGLFVGLLGLCLGSQFAAPTKVWGAEEHRYTVESITMDTTSAEFSTRFSSEISAHAKGGELVSIVNAQSPGHYVAIYRR
jgi:hypothetical protein